MQGIEPMRGIAQMVRPLPSLKHRPVELLAFCFVLCLCLGAGAARAQIQVSGTWARATAPQQSEGAIYLTITSASPDRLTGVASADAAETMLHKTTAMGGMSGMTDMDMVDLPAGKPVRFAPHGMHIMLMGLKHPLVAGSHIGLDLMFQKAGTVHASVPVQPITADGPPG